MWEANPTGPFDHWPHPGGGFEYFYGFIGGETNQWYPNVYENTTPVEPWGTPEEGYHFMDDMTDKAIAWTRQQKSLAPGQAVLHLLRARRDARAAPRARRSGPTGTRARFDQGWDAIREETFARQKELGVIPADAVLTERSAGIPAWDEMSEQIKPVLAREMEVYAGFLSYADHHVGRLIDAIEELGILDDTLIYVIIGDNGASAEGNFIGTTNEGFTINHMNELETEDYMVEHMDDLGTPELVQPLRHRLGARDGHAVPVDQAGRLALGRHPQRHHRPLAERHHGQGRDPQPVRPLHRRRPDRSSRRPASPSRTPSTA